MCQNSGQRSTGRRQKVIHQYVKRNAISLCHELQPVPNPALSIVIPAYREHDIDRCINSIAKSFFAGSASQPVVVFIVINASTDAPKEDVKENRSTINQVEKLQKKFNDSLFHIICINRLFKPKHAGVGAARKEGMDQLLALYLKHENPDGIIMSLDADCTVSDNYIEGCIKQGVESQSVGFSVHFEHDLELAENQDQSKAIISYELYLRYYANELKKSGYPFPFHTIGSAFGVKAFAYAKVGGMNRRKAGEDFYFLHKLFLIGKFKHVSQALVYPSPRLSDRVIFGTGPALIKIISDEGHLKVYHPHCFTVLARLFSDLPALFELPSHWHNSTPQQLISFLEKLGFDQELPRIVKSSKTLPTFKKHFFAFFNGLIIIKALKHLSLFFPYEDILKAIKASYNIQSSHSLEELLCTVRKLDQTSQKSYK